MVQPQSRGIQHPTARGCTVARHPVDVQTAEAVRAVVPDRPSTGAHVHPTVDTREGLIHMDGVRADLRRPRAVEKSADQTLSGQAAVEASARGLGLERRQEARVPVEIPSKTLDLAPGANPGKARERIC